MPTPNDQNAFDPDRYRDAEAQLGGADGVPKTTYVTGEGTSPERRKGEGPTARVRSAGAPKALSVFVLAIVALGVLAYLVGLAW